MIEGHQKVTKMVRVQGMKDEIYRRCMSKLECASSVVCVYVRFGASQLSR